jgi:type II secretory ATPase GspE/PulE/Tfp pilus assembly ATPase PilB-like protein
MLPFRSVALEGGDLVFQGWLQSRRHPLEQVHGWERPFRRWRGVVRFVLVGGGMLDVLAAPGSPVDEVLAQVDAAMRRRFLLEDSPETARLNVEEWRAELRRALEFGVSHRAALFLESLLQRGYEFRITDYHFQPATGGVVEVRFRLDGLLHSLLSLEAETYQRVLTRTRVLARLPLVVRHVSQEGSFAPTKADGRQVRVSILPVAGSEKMTLRLLGGERGRRTLEGLGFPEEQRTALEAALSRRQGLILVCGPANSGKTTTLYACLRHLREQDQRHVITLEDPVEMPLSGVTQVPVEETRGFGYAEALAAALRGDPEVLMVGEIRGRNTAEAVVQAACTGHLILSTLHAGSVAQALQRIEELGIGRERWSTVVLGVIVQRLARRVCGFCRQPTGEPGSFSPPAPTCATCLGTGYAGLIPLVEACWGEDVAAPASLPDEPVERLVPTAHRALEQGRTDQAELQRLGLTP